MMPLAAPESNQIMANENSPQTRRRYVFFGGHVVPEDLPAFGIRTICHIKREVLKTHAFNRRGTFRFLIFPNIFTFCPYPVSYSQRHFPFPGHVRSWTVCLRSFSSLSASAKSLRGVLDLPCISPIRLPEF